MKPAERVAEIGPEIAQAWNLAGGSNMGWRFRMDEDRGRLERDDGFTVLLRPDGPGRIGAQVWWPYDQGRWSGPSWFAERDAVDPRATADASRNPAHLAAHYWRKVVLPGLALWPACQDWHAARRAERRHRDETARECGMIAGREPYKVGGDDLYLSQSLGCAATRNSHAFGWSMRFMEGGAVEVKGTFGRAHADAIAHCFAEIEEAAKRAAKEDA